MERNSREFQFPSNGKAYTKIPYKSGSVWPTNVSIPFKRESIYKEIYPIDCDRVIAVSIPFKRESIYKVPLAGSVGNRSKNEVSIPFKRESIYKATRWRLMTSMTMMGFNSLQTGKHIQRCCGINWWNKGDISFNSLQTGKHIQRDPILSPVGPWLRSPKTKRELRGAIFKQNFSPKIPQTLVNIDPNAISQQNRLRSETPSGFLGNLSRTRTRLVNRVWVYLLSIP